LITICLESQTCFGYNKGILVKILLNNEEEIDEKFFVLSLISEEKNEILVSDFYTQ